MKQLFIFLLIFCAFFANNAVAAVVINEVMYDVSGTDTDREWLEVANIGNEAVDLTGWKLFEANVNHSLTVNQGSANIPAGGYAVIVDSPVKFLTDWPGFSGAVLDSSFSLSNSGESLVLKDASSAVIDEVNYDVSIGAGGDGNSLQRSATAGVWLSALPTPGLTNATTAYIPPVATSTPPVATSTDPGTATTTSVTATSTPNNSGGSGTYVSTHSSSVSLSSAVAPVALSASAGRKRLVSVGVPVSFASNQTADINDSDVTWTLGDGGSATGKNISHDYLFTGTYEVVLNVRRGAEQAVSRTSVEVVQPAVSFLMVGPERVVIRNDGPHELNLGDWQLGTDSQKFVFPRDTIIVANGQLNLPAAISRLQLDSSSALSLYYPSGALALRNDHTSVSQSDLALALEALRLALAEQHPEGSLRLATQPTPSPIQPSVENQGQLAAVSTLGQTVTLDPNPPKKSWWQKLFSR